MLEIHNTYFVIRHGESYANEEGIIVSNPDNGIPEYGLTEEGKRQVAQSIEKIKGDGILDHSIIIVSSDFARAKETAEIARAILGSTGITFSPKLRERSFGIWDKTENANYQKVWDIDRDDSKNPHEGVESVANVLARAIALIKSLEDQYVGRKILLVSHGDTLQILQTVFKGVKPSLHRDMKHLKTAEVRRLN